MSRGAKITLLILILILIGAVAAWFYFSGWRASAAAKYIEEGDKFFEKGDFAHAIISYKKAGVLTPRSPAPYFKQGILARENGHYSEAIEFFQKSVGFGSTVIWPEMSLAETYLLAGKTDNAKTSFLAAKRIDPSNDNILFYLTKIALINNNSDEAEEYLHDVIEINPAPKYKIYQALVKAFSDPSESLELMAKFEEDVTLGEMSLSDFVSLFQKLTITGSTTSREIMLAQTFNQIGEADFAIKRLEIITSEDPDIRDAWVFLGYGYLLKNENEKGKVAIDKAIKIDPVYAFSYYLLGKYYDQKGQFAQAKDAYQKAEELGFSEDNPLAKEG